MRILSLLPAATEILYALGLEPVGRSHECDYPVQARALPACTTTTLPGGERASSRAIDAAVKQRVNEGLSLYEIDTDKLAALAPDLIITQTQCEVCAVSENDLRDALARTTDKRPEIVSLSPSTLGDVWEDIGRVAQAAGVPERGRALAADLATRVAEVGEACEGREAASVVCLEWLDPLMAAGHWMPELVRIAGGRSRLGPAGARSPWITPAQLAEADPDVLLVAPCGFDLTRTLAELPALRAQDGFSRLRAVRSGRVGAADGSAFFNRPGPRLVESLEILAELLHPDAVPVRHCGVAWKPV